MIQYSGEIFRSFFIYGGMNEISNGRKAKCSSYNCKSHWSKNKKKTDIMREVATLFHGVSVI